jgi:hypothetical protein
MASMFAATAARLSRRAIPAVAGQHAVLVLKIEVDGYARIRGLAPASMGIAE